ncbi:MAG TPA: SAM-dependent methyltransferase [Ilumatobacteraceae bacterium]|nr:SAM-dependent methyltransferase [Ilumatobacteraceae bacterium]
MTEYFVRPIGHVSSERSSRIDDDWGSVESAIRLDEGRFTPDSVAGLEEFSHVEVIFLFDQFDEAKVAVGARHPRGNEAWPKVGIFAQRASSRPNRLGLTTCELLGVEGLDVRVRRLDAIDGTPVLDIKPHMREFEPRGNVRQPSWSSELMAGYW